MPNAHAWGMLNRSCHFLENETGYSDISVDITNNGKRRYQQHNNYWMTKSGRSWITVFWISDLSLRNIWRCTSVKLLWSTWITSGQLTMSAGVGSWLFCKKIFWWAMVSLVLMLMALAPVTSSRGGWRYFWSLLVLKFLRTLYTLFDNATTITSYKF